MTQEPEVAIAVELANLRKLPAAKLAALGEIGKTVQIRVHEQTYQINTWAEPVPGDSSGAFAVLADTWSRSFLGVSTRHLMGFVVSADGTRSDIPTVSFSGVGENCQTHGQIDKRRSALF